MTFFAKTNYYFKLLNFCKIFTKVKYMSQTLRIFKHCRQSNLILLWIIIMNQNSYILGASLYSWQQFSAVGTAIE